MELFLPLLNEGRALRVKLEATGQHPEILKKLQYLCDLNYLKGGEAEKLRNLIKQVEK
jgi:hypothetical protein